MTSGLDLKWHGYLNEESRAEPIIAECGKPTYEHVDILVRIGQYAGITLYLTREQADSLRRQLADAVMELDIWRAVEARTQTRTTGSEVAGAEATTLVEVRSILSPDAAALAERSNALHNTRLDDGSEGDKSCEKY